MSSREELLLLNVFSKLDSGDREIFAEMIDKYSTLDSLDKKWALIKINLSITELLDNDKYAPRYSKQSNIIYLKGERR